MKGSGGVAVSGGGSAPMAAKDYGVAIALCGAIKYGSVAALSSAKRVAGVVANLTGSMDEHAVVAGA